ncbi:5'-phosphate synthase pdxT subunit [Sinosporangium album]|uniref:Pyridoxal 5'-phosphate synthase subunit PdxT n=1 Tax=Sinosporangium album TaxID=504805 RepID=A0A1G8IV00_9ACTN|nr:pyridoxal 5'-phosphate synthase glutaminase subunit PdxT [Sinosporangium album]SDI22848.1 5'-phosphate synthase pdxT subunit [Sinosporangium album]
MTAAPTVGVLALQGDVREHLHSLAATGLRAVGVRRQSELDAVDALVIPGGESTTMWKLAEAFGMLEPVRMRIKEGMPAYGSCAGMIMLADRLEGGMEGQQTFGGIDMVVRRNAFGRQVDSFESDLEFAGLGQVRAVFIRAPWVESVGAGVEVLAQADAGDRIVAVRQGPLLATSFHPELTGEGRVHSYFAEMVRES